MNEFVAKSNAMSYNEIVTKSCRGDDMARGGKRPGAGRKPRWGVPTVTIRVPESLRDEIEAFIAERMAMQSQIETATKSEQGHQQPAVTENVTKSDKPAPRRRRSETATKPKSKLQAPIPLELHAHGQCQAATRSGTRCRGRVSSYLSTTLPDGREAWFAVCAVHCRSGSVRLHPSVIEIATKSK